MRRCFVSVAALSLLVTLAGCSSDPGPTTTDVPTRSAASEPTRSGFPTTTFADLSEDPLGAETSAILSRTLEGAAGGNGVTATLITAKGAWTGATGTSDGVKALRPDAQMAIGSITKTIIAAQVMQLVEAGKLRLEDQAAGHLPSGVEFDTNGATVGNLLAMRSGIPDYVDAIWDSLTIDGGHVWADEELLALVPPARTPAGSEFEYSNTNYILLGLILEQATGRPVAETLRDGVLAGPGLERLVYQPAERPTKPIAMPDGQPAGAIKNWGGYLPSMAGASAARTAGGIASDSATLARWWARLCGGRILSEASFAAMTDFEQTPQYALGIQDWSEWDGPSAVGNDGMHVGFVSHAECLPDEGAVVVVLINDGAANSSEVANALLDAIEPH